MDARPQLPGPAGRFARCLGRERELALVEQRFAETQSDGRGRVLLVTGPAGIGKSCFVQELKRRLHGRGAIVVEGRSRDGARAFQPMIELVDGVVRHLGELGVSSLAVRGADTTARLCGGDGATRETAGADLEEARRLGLFEAVSGFLTDAARHLPLVLVVHDLHTADRATRALVHHLAETRFPAAELDAPGCGPADDHLGGLLLLTSRDPEDGWLDGADLGRIELGALDDGGVRELLQSPEVVRLVAEATGGRPDALEALLAAPPPDDRVVFRGRMAQLSPSARRLLEALAVAGRPTPPEALRAACMPGASTAPATADTAEAACDPVGELVGQHLVENVIADGELRLAFIRRRDEEIAYADIAADVRDGLHRAIGRSLMRSGSADDVVAAAEHLLRGSAGEEAVDAALAAGQRLAEAFAYDRAIALYRAAHAHTGREDVRVVIEERLVELGRLVGDYASALDDAERVRRRRPDDPAVLRAIGQLHLLRDDYGRAHAALGEARELALRAGRDDELPRIIAAVAETCLLDGRHADAIAECEVGLLATSEERRRAAAVPHRLDIRNTLGKVHLAEGRYEAAESLFAANLDEARSFGVRFEEARALINRGIARLRLGDNAGAAECYQAALKVADAALDHRHRAFCLQNLGVLAHWRGEFAAARRYFHEAIAAFKRLGQRGRVAWVALDLASLYLDVGAADRAASMVTLADRLVEPRVTAQVRFKRAIIAGRLARHHGDLDQARRQFEEARTATGDANPEYTAEATLAIGWLELEAGRVEEAATLAQSLVGTTGALSSATAARARLLDGEVDVGRGLPGARRALLEAAESFHRLGDLDGEWRAQFALARAAAAAADHAECERRLRRALLVDSRLRERVPEELLPAYDAEPVRRALARAAADLQLPRSSPAFAMPAAHAGPVESCSSEPLAAAPADSASSASSDRYERIVGRNPRMKQIYALVDKVARHQSVVLIRGESGTGKELVAEAIHLRSPRASQPLVKVNCGALVESLLLSELFGHERGAFTGALQRKKGRFEAAHQGTIFLDEIGDISPRTQMALLRVIQEREFERVGSATPIKVDVRIICATNRNLEEMVARGEFREDLYYRLKGIEIELPPLRERADDVPLIAGDILRRIAEERSAPPMQIGPEAMEVLQRYRWPGNVRELENVLRSVSVLCDGDRIGVRELGTCPTLFRPDPASLERGAAAPGSAGTAMDATVAWERMGAEGIGLRELQARIEVECIRRALAASHGNITRAAELLKMKRPRLSQLIKEHGIAL